MRDRCVAVLEQIPGVELVETFARAVCAISRFRGARFGQVGTRPQLFESQAWSEEQMQRQFGQRVVSVDLDTAFACVDAIPACSARSTICRICRILWSMN